MIRTILNPTDSRDRAHRCDPSPFSNSRSSAAARIFMRSRSPSGDTSYVSAGVPWFMCLFGRDTLVSALMSGVLGDWPARGALAALAPLQATDRDDWRDAEPGKLPHELRRGELAFRKVIPHTPYYGTHDAPALVLPDAVERVALDRRRRRCSTRIWRRPNAPCSGATSSAIATATGCRSTRPVASSATTTRVGRTPRDAILDPTGGLAKLPIATIELQGYLYAARLAMAELYEHVGDDAEAARLRDSATALRGLVEDRYWLDDEGFYAVALDGDKEPVRTISFQPGATVVVRSAEPGPCPPDCTRD